jgi:hypothetical protein
MASQILYVESISGKLAGQKSRLGLEVLKSKTTAAALPPGVFVCRSSTDQDCKVPTTAAEVLAAIGVTMIAPTIAVSGGNYPIATEIPVLAATPGVWVVTIDAAVQGGQVFVNYAGANQKGSVSAAFVAGENVALPGARFGSTQATPGGLVEIEYSLPSGGTLGDFGAGKGFVDVVVDVPSIAANVAPDISTAVAGSLVGDRFLVSSLTALNAGLVVDANAACRVAGTVVWRIGNVTVGALDPASNTYRFSLVSRG